MRRRSVPGEQLSTEPDAETRACQPCKGDGRIPDGNAFGWPWTIPCPTCGGTGRVTFLPLAVHPR